MEEEHISVDSVSREGEEVGIEGVTNETRQALASTDIAEANIHQMKLKREYSHLASWAQMNIQTPLSYRMVFISSSLLT